MDATETKAASPGDDLQEELQAALADIEKMSAGSPVAVATLGDDRGETDDSRSEKDAPPPRPESATGESTAADNASTSDVEALQASPGDADTGEPAPTSDKGPSLPGEPGGGEPAGAAQQGSPDVNDSDSEPAPQDAPPTPSKASGNVPATAETTQPSQENRLLADAELAAELTKIEQMSNEEVAAIPALDDGNEQEEGPATPDDQGASAGHEPAPDSETQLGDEELTATLAEAGKALASLKADLPQHDAANADTPDGPAKPENSDSSDSTPPVDGESQREAAPAAPQPVRKKMRFQVGEKPAESVAEYRPPAEPGDPAPLAQPVVPLDKRLSRAVDNGLDTINQPFERMDQRTRTLVGYVAATTLAISILATILMPQVMPHRDAIVFLQEKRAALDTPPPVEEGDEGGAGDEEGVGDESAP